MCVLPKKVLKESNTFSFVLECYHDVVCCMQSLLDMNPTRGFMRLVEMVRRDSSVLLDFLVSNETCFLLYLLRYLKFIVKVEGSFLSESRYTLMPVCYLFLLCWIGRSTSVLATHDMPYLRIDIRHKCVVRYIFILIGFEPLKKFAWQIFSSQIILLVWMSSFCTGSL
jgi:hypothetical protein